MGPNQRSFTFTRPLTCLENWQRFTLQQVTAGGFYLM
jgi:hypothetical protein